MALLITEAASGHVEVRPRLVEPGTVTFLRIELPELRAGSPPVRLDVEGYGVTVLASRLRAVVGSETLWHVGLRVRRDVTPRELPLRLRAFFADGESVQLEVGIIVVPSVTEKGRDAFPWLGLALGVTLALVLAAGGLVVARRRRR